MSDRETVARIGLVIQGRVQGVGFRPFIWRLARGLNLTGFVKNTSAGVRVEVQGKASRLEKFKKDLQENLPPLAKISSLKQEELPALPDETGFEIAMSSGHAGQNVLVSPDIGICPECLADVRDPDNFRHGYPFTNCVNCGPRYTITASIPYDRISTTMACFDLCDRCAREYSNPENRRFHAQPIACPECGPSIWHVSRADLEKGQTLSTGDDAGKALDKAGRDILEGKIVAIKGLGGFQLACNARSAEAVSLLRSRKNRPHKALAVMARDLAAASLFCDLEQGHIRHLQSPENPIVLCPKKSGEDLAGAIAPDVPHIGVMLPYMPLHVLLFDWLHENGLPDPVLVMTSANPSGEPICLGNREALSRLTTQADSWLLHNRDILVRVDDSVMAVHPALEENPLLLRRARGYVPVPQSLPPLKVEPSVLGMGGDLKNAFCLTRLSQAFMSQHIGDLDNAGNLTFFRETLTHLGNLLECRPSLIVRDLHPDFASSQLAEELARKDGLPIIALQHHAAHAAAVLGENMCYEPALALCLDGTGLGEDKSVWGGELVLMDLSIPRWQRVGSFTPFPLPGGEKAILEPWRIALGLNFMAGAIAEKNLDRKSLALLEMLKHDINCPRTSSCGRLFDSVAAHLGLCDNISYEGQAAIRLMNAAWPLASGSFAEISPPPRDWLTIDANLPRVDSLALFTATSQIYRKRGNVAEAASFFHISLADALTQLCLNAASKYAVSKIGLNGGVMQNFLLASLLHKSLSAQGLQVLWPLNLPPGDGGLAFGQVVWGRQLLAAGKAAPPA